ncbi:MAG: type IV pilin [Haloplanus sp.]
MSRAQSETVATVLVLALVVILVSVVGYVVLGTIEPDDDPTVDIEATVTDSTVTLAHRGGENLRDDDLAVVLRYGGTEERYDFATDGSYGDDAVFEPGDRWRLDAAVPYATGDRVEVLLIHDPSNAVLFSGRNVAATTTPTATPAPPAAGEPPETGWTTGPNVGP